jgi:hypothetical protein
MEDIADLPSRLLPDERTLPRMLRRQAVLYGDRRLVEIDGQAWSFTETLEMAACFGGALHAAGIKRGDHSVPRIHQRNSPSRKGRGRQSPIARGDRYQTFN